MTDAVSPAAAGVSEDGGCGGGGSGSGSAARRERLPRWSRREILVLIEGKRAVEGQGRGRTALLTGPVGAPTESKWAAIAAYCRRFGMDRGPLQCRKRWSNLTCDFKKVREWELAAAAEKESFWAMRSDRRREQKLPGSFDREIYEILTTGATVGVVEEEEEEVKPPPPPPAEREEEAVFDSERTATEDGLFSDFEHEEEEDEEEEEERPAVVVTPISERKYEPIHEEFTHPGMVNGKHFPDDSEKGSSLQGQKRRRKAQGGTGDDSTLQNQLIDVLERNSKMLTSQLEAQNMNSQLDRDQRKDQADSLLGVLNKLADALGRIADKL